jgi:N4-(beta-N-acetylglucosaminyl)-L-asparaginase
MRVVKLMERRNKNLKDIQVGFIALNKLGEHGAYCVQSGFNFAIQTNTRKELIDAPYYLKV